MNTERRRLIRETLARFEEPLNERALANVTGIGLTDLSNELRSMEIDKQVKRKLVAPYPGAKQSRYAWALK